jgi:glycosyltransferase involved in cell wall biosynthesis
VLLDHLFFLMMFLDVRALAVGLGANPEKTETIYLGVDVEKFKPTKKRKRITIGTLGRLIPEKNIQEIL